MHPFRIPRRARLLVPAVLVLGAAVLFLTLSSPSAGTAPADPAAVAPANPATAAPGNGDPFAVAGVDAAGAPRVLLPRVHSLSDAVETVEGWIVLDRRNDRIHALDPSGRIRWSAGGEGRGPGELDRPIAITVVDSTVVVADARGTSLDRFDLDGRFVARTALRATDCMGNLVRGMSPWEGGDVVLLRLCLDAGSGAMRVRADRVAPDGAASLLASLPLKDLRRPGDDLLATGVLASRGRTLYLGVTSSRCVRAYRWNEGSGGSEPGAMMPLPPVCLPETDAVPIPEEERRRLDEALERRPLARSLGLSSPATLPPFDGIFAADSGLVFRTLTSLEGRSLVRVAGGAAEPIAGVPATEHTFVGSRSALVSWQEMAGTALRIVRLADRDERP